MSSNLFYLDRLSSVRKTYGDLIASVHSLDCVPEVCSTADEYSQLVTLVASLCSHHDISLSNGSRVDGNKQDIAGRRIHVDVQVADLWNRILHSQAKIGLFTSGTTGRAKLIQHSVETLVRTVRRSPHHQSDIWGLTYQPASFAGLQIVLQAICNSNPLIRLVDLDPNDIHHEFESTGITHLSATPTWLRLVCSDGAVHRAVRSVTMGGEIADLGLIDQVRTAFPNAKVRNIYASTESGSLFQTDGELFRVPQMIADRIRVEDGILAIHRSLLAESLRDSFALEFYSTGDCVEVLSEDPLTFRFLARRSDWINVGGNKVNPHQIEQILSSMSEVSHCRVFGRNNSVVGSIVCCEIVLAVGRTLTQMELRQRLEGVFPPFMIPRVYTFVESIEKTATGKKSRSD